MKLSKLAPAGTAEAAAYSWWVVTSLALQARAALLGQDQQGRPLAAASGGAAAGGLPPDKLLQLAESMAGRQAKAAEAAAAAKQGQAGKAAAMAAVGWTYEALLLYLDILQGQGKAREALQVRFAVKVIKQLVLERASWRETGGHRLLGPSSRHWLVVECAAATSSPARRSGGCCATHQGASRQCHQILAVAPLLLIQRRCNRMGWPGAQVD